MNKYPGWLNALVVIIFLTGLLLALPNIYGSAPAVQLSGLDGTQLSEARLEQIVQTIENAGITAEAAYLKDGRAVLRFTTVEDQRDAADRLRERYKRCTSIALTLALTTSRRPWPSWFAPSSCWRRRCIPRWSTSSSIL